MTRDEIVSAFAEFLGPDRYEKFLDVLRTTCRDRNELMWWQENAWERFAERQGLRTPATFPALRRLFRGHRAPQRYPVMPNRLPARSIPPRRLPLDCTDDDIRALVVEWSELLASDRYADALALVDLVSVPWTPDFLEFWLSNYGSDRPWPDGQKFHVTSIYALPDAHAVIKGIDVDRENPYGLDTNRYLGMVHYDDLPLNGVKSDLTAQFCIRRVWKRLLTLELHDIHVM